MLMCSWCSLSTLIHFTNPTYNPRLSLQKLQLEARMRSVPRFIDNCCHCHVCASHWAPLSSPAASLLCLVFWPPLDTYCSSTHIATQQLQCAVLDDTASSGHQCTHTMSALLLPMSKLLTSPTAIYQKTLHQKLPDAGQGAVLDSVCLLLPFTSVTSVPHLTQVHAFSKHACSSQTMLPYTSPLVRRHRVRTDLRLLDFNKRFRD